MCNVYYYMYACEEATRLRDYELRATSYELRAGARYEQSKQLHREQDVLLVPIHS